MIGLVLWAIVILFISFTYMYNLMGAVFVIFVILAIFFGSFWGVLVDMGGVKDANREFADMFKHLFRFMLRPFVLLWKKCRSLRKPSTE